VRGMGDRWRRKGDEAVEKIGVGTWKERLP
jgi:hypothetical protein